MSQQEHLEAFGDEQIDDGESDFASEHSDTTVDPAITDADKGEEESPRGWDGMDREGPP